MTKQATYATDFVEELDDESITIDQRIKQGYQLDIVVYFPRCFVSENCPVPRYRGYSLCEDRPDMRCTRTYREADVVCRMGEYSLFAKRFFAEHQYTGKVLVIPGGRQVVDLCLACGLPRVAVGVACPPDLKEGRLKMRKIGVKSFLVPLTKLKFDLHHICKAVVQSCYENVFKHGIGHFEKTLIQAAEYIDWSKKVALTPEDFIKQGSAKK